MIPVNISAAERLNRIIGDHRIELKYRLDNYQYFRLKNALKPFFNLDIHSLNSSGNTYLVRSLYFDTSDYKGAYEKINGDFHRLKIRLRTYSDSMPNWEPSSASGVTPRCEAGVTSGGGLIRAELKVRLGNRVIKYSAPISMEGYYCLLRRGRYFGTDDPVFNEFMRCQHLGLLHPVVLVDYHREALEDKTAEGLRITFDHKVRSLQSKELFPDNCNFFRYHWPRSIVMEVKCRKMPPDWFLKIMNKEGLKMISNSKYAQAIQAARHDLYRSGRCLRDISE